MEAPATGETKPPTPTLLAEPSSRPVDAQVLRLVDRDLGDDGLHVNLRPADVEFIDDHVQRPHGALPSRDHQRIGGLVGPDRGLSARQ